MALEEEIARLNKNLERHNALLEQVLGNAEKNVKGGTADTKADAPKADTKADTKADAPKATRGRQVKEKAISPDDMAKATTDFLEVDDEDEYANRRAFVKKIITKYGAPKMSAIAEEDRKEALAYLDDYKAGNQTDLDEEDMA